MKRKHYDIVGTNGFTAVKSTWGACLTLIEEVVRKIAREEETFYERTISETEKNSNGDYVQGTCVWKGHNGRSVTFFVRKAETTPEPIHDYADVLFQTSNGDHYHPTCFHKVFSSEANVVHRSSSWYRGAQCKSCQGSTKTPRKI